MSEPSGALERPALERGRLARRLLWSLLASAAALAAAALALSRTEIGAEALSELWAQTSLGWVLASIGVVAVGMVFYAMRWRALIPGGRRIPAIPLGGIACTGLLLNYALPGPVGELFAAAWVGRRWSLSGPVVLAADLHARFLGLGMAGALAGGIWLTADLPIPEGYDRLIGGIALAISVGAAGMAALSARPALLSRISAGVWGRLGRRGGAVGRGAAGLDRALQELAEGLGRVTRLGARAWGEAALWALLTHCAVAAGIGTGALALGTDPHLGGIFFTYCATTAGAIALFALPGGQVGWDAMFFAFLTATSGLSPADAAAVTLLVRIQQTSLLLIGSGSLAWMGGQEAAR